MKGQLLVDRVLERAQTSITCARGLAHSKRSASSPVAANFRQVLECGSPLPLLLRCPRKVGTFDEGSEATAKAPWQSYRPAAQLFSYRRRFFQKISHPIMGAQ